MTRAMARRDFGTPGVKKFYAWALGMHGAMLLWNPTILRGGSAFSPPPLMQVEFRETPPPLTLPVDKKPIPHPARLSHRVAAHTRMASRRPVARMPVRHKFRHIPLALPRFTPHAASDDLLVSQAHPSQVLPVPAHATASNPFSKTQHLVSKSRGVRINDVRFELSEPGALSEKAGAGRVISIPLGDERGDVAEIASAPSLHAAAGDGRHAFTTRYRPGASGGELVGRHRSGVRAPVDMDAYGTPDAVLAAGGAGKGISASGSGFEIGGPVGDRKVLRKHLPEYPPWAEEKGISAIVKIWFTVRPDGKISSSMRILASSGYPELDSLAKDALRQWRFSSTPVSSSDEAWGVITFRFTLA